MNLGKKATEEDKDFKKEVKKEILGHKKVSVTKKEEIEKQEKLKALTRSRIIKKKIKRLDFMSNVLFLISFALIIFVILRYVFYICYELNQCETVNWLLVTGILSIIVVFLIVVRFEKTRIKTALLKIKEMRSKKEHPKQDLKHSKEKLKLFVNRTNNLRDKINNNPKINVKNAYHDLYLVFKSFVSEYFQIPKAMSTTELAKLIEANENLNPKFSKYVSDLLIELFNSNYADVLEREKLIVLAEATQKVMNYLFSKK